ncbi:GtrA family protein [Tundrisphaera lichenicola]|uniref:GtrA family protein n=1 Tax=Tundrisphaera lichenicola TaxID=2029860 RepID=UPI003EBBBE8F
MSRLSLITLQAPGIPWPSGRLAACRARLEEQGYEVEALAVSDPQSKLMPGSDEPWCDSMIAEAPGLSVAAITGLRASVEDLLVILDLSKDYPAEAVVAVADRLAVGDAEMVVASRPNRWLGWLSFRFLGTTDPTSGLIGLTRAMAREADESFAPVGSHFALELLARVGGSRVDLPVGPIRSVRDDLSPTFLGELRQFKRLADDRLGNVSRLLQFCFVGASGMVVDLTCYAGLQALLARSFLTEMTAPIVGGSMALAVSAILAIATALTWNFSLNRRLTFNDSRQGSISRQYLRYVLSNLLGIGVSLTLRLALPNTFGFFRDHRLAAALVGIIAATGISFSMARWFVFGQKPASEHPVPVPRRRQCAGLRLHTRRRPPRPLQGLPNRSDSSRVL